jgi:hypothetical protein
MQTVLLKEEFEYLNKDMKESLIKYLDKNLEGSAQKTGGRGSYLDEEDHFVNIDNMIISLPEGYNVPVQFTTNWIKGDLTDLEDSANLDTKKWCLLIQFLDKIIKKSLAMLLAEKKEKHFFRVRLGYMGPPLDGEYYIRNFRISPATRVEGTFHVENYIYLDMDIEGIDYEHARSNSRTFAKEVMSILSVILNTGFYEPGRDHRWVLLPDNKHGRFQLGFHDEEPYPTAMPAKDRKKAGAFSVDPTDYISNAIHTKTLRLPRSIRKLFKAYYSLAKEEQAAFLSASRMYQISISADRISKTVQASYQLAALDALSKPYRQKNLNKNAIMELTDKYYVGEGVKIGKLYESIRNAHFHQGFFDEHEISGFEIRPFLGPKWIMKEIDYLFRTKIVFVILNKWLFEKVSEES